MFTKANHNKRIKNSDKPVLLKKKKIYMIGIIDNFYKLNWKSIDPVYNSG